MDLIDSRLRNGGSPNAALRGVESSRAQVACRRERPAAQGPRCRDARLRRHPTLRSKTPSPKADSARSGAACSSISRCSNPRRPGRKALDGNSQPFRLPKLVSTTLNGKGALVRETCDFPGGDRRGGVGRVSRRRDGTDQSPVDRGSHLMLAFRCLRLDCATCDGEFRCRLPVG